MVFWTRHLFSCSLDVKRVVKSGDECEFTVAPDAEQGMVATRIKHLPSGSVEFDVVIHKEVSGKVVTEPQRILRLRRASNDDSDQESPGNKEGAGKIVYDLNGLSLEIPLFASDCEDLKDFPHKDDIISFDINQSKATKETNAVNIRVIESPYAIREAKKGPQSHQGYIAALKDG